MKTVRKLKIASSHLLWGSLSAFLFFVSNINTARATEDAVAPALKGLENPIKVDTLAGFIKSILDVVIMIGIPVVALAIIYSGFLFVKAKGDPEGLKTAKATFLGTIIGAAIVLGSWVLAQAICETVAELGASAKCQ